MSPVVTVEPVTDLWGDICEVEGGIHGFLGPFCVCGWDVVAPVVAGAEIVFEVGAEFLGDGGVFDEGAAFAVAFALGEGFGSDVFCDPVRVLGAAIIRGD